MKTRILRTLAICILLLSFSVNISAQFRLKTEILGAFLFSSANSERNHSHFGLELGFKLKRKGDYLELAAQHISSTLIWGESNFSESTKLTARVKYSHYTNRRSKTLNSGFYNGLFIDFSHFKSKASKYYDATSKVDFKKGMIPSIGYHLGYTFKIKKIIIEPSLGIGVGSVTEDLHAKPGTFKDLSGIENSFMSISSSFAEINIGYEF